MEENLAQIIKTTSRYDCMLSVIMMDVDFFKKYNDTYGHSMGDECLKKVAEALNRAIRRPDDFLARYGGEEFICVLPNTEECGARLIAERMLKNVRELQIPHATSEAADWVTISLGITSGRPVHTHKGEDYVRRADAALYSSKQNGRNRYTFIDFKEDA